MFPSGVNSISVFYSFRLSLLYSHIDAISLAFFFSILLMFVYFIHIYNLLSQNWHTYLSSYYPHKLRLVLSSDTFPRLGIISYFIPFYLKQKGFNGLRVQLRLQVDLLEHKHCSIWISHTSKNLPLPLNSGYLTNLSHFQREIVDPPN